MRTPRRCRVRRMRWRCFSGKPAVEVKLPFWNGAGKGAEAMAPRLLPQTGAVDVGLIPVGRLGEAPDIAARSKRRYRLSGVTL